MSKHNVILLTQAINALLEPTHPDIGDYERIRVLECCIACYEHFLKISYEDAVMAIRTYKYRRLSQKIETKLALIL